MASTEDTTHQAISSYFIGPQAENLGEFRKNITTLLDELQLTRERYFSEDVTNGYTFIPQAVQDSGEFKRVTAKTSTAVQQAAAMLGRHSIPFWSPRYQAHMCTDLSMPAMLGYMMTMMYNPNNVALEASPISTVAEIEVGEQLCEMFGYVNEAENSSEPTAWGHVTCGGTVANLESIWVARNLKFYPLSVRKAMDDTDGPLAFLPESFGVRTSQGQWKPFRQLSTWELLNLKPKTILDLPEQLHQQFGITPTWLQAALDPYNIQTCGKDVLERHFDLDKPAQYFVAATKHYSWPKGAAVVGIGSENLVNVSVDDAARLDINILEQHLARCLREKQPVYAVVAVIGSTEEGAVDPLRKILALRQVYQAKGLSFVVHADAAWGGYFATMLPKRMDRDPVGGMPGRAGGGDGIVPDLCLRVETQEDLFALRYCDSITVDPHKAGYIPYPAGALAYRDGRIKNLVTWTSPYLSRGSVTSIGIYGVEGSKPGAAAVATWLSNRVIGLHPQGYGALLSEACFTSSRFSALWAALSKPEDSFICVPFNMLPSEASGDPQKVEQEKERIRNEILTQTNAAIVANDAGKPAEDKTMTLLRALGSDLNINAFALNWRCADGTLNTDVEEANYLMNRVIRRLSVDSPDDNPATIPLYLTSTEFSKKDYGACASTFKRRLGLEVKSAESLMVLRNVVMSPFASLSSRGDFINMLGDTLKQVIEEEVEVCRARNEDTADYHSFLIRGTKKLFLSYRSMFHIAKHRHQTILSAEFDKGGAQVYREVKGNTEEEIILKTVDKIDLQDLLQQVGSGESPWFMGNLETASNGVVHCGVRVQITSVIKNRPLRSAEQDESYPAGFVPFYLYGTTQEPHIDHMLTRSPNITLSADTVAIALSSGGEAITDAALAAGAILSIEGQHEASMQPFGEKNSDLPPGGAFFFASGKKFDAKIWTDPRGPHDSALGLVAEVHAKEPVAKGRVTLQEEVVVDVEKLNRDPFRETDATKVARWREHFEQIGREVDKI
ncbi:pyridoxal phosphate-dependent transferase [Podospora aff. communis PSN243]|uniref:Pyridoxal phosphate-dependent transferase n=1 Tax=Podospora aff. communis PSN243 TaxID=3040156 RepID=A0AAV9G6T9_9PEZI|nr:pyridoxal phosphate-dependent transferase [Podospora aff. communis PSN243]